MAAAKPGLSARRLEGDIRIAVAEDVAQPFDMGRVVDLLQDDDVGILRLQPRDQAVETIVGVGAAIDQPLGQGDRWAQFGVEGQEPQVP